MSQHARVTGGWFLLSLQLGTAMLFFISAVGFVRRSERTGDELAAWFAVGSVVAGFARIHYFLFPSVFTGWVYTGDAFRLVYYVILLVGAAREIGNYWGRAAVLEERRRLARDLHDGLAQELALVATLAKRMSGFRGSDQLAGAAERALDEARRAITALTAAPDQPFDEALAQAAEDAAARTGTPVRLDLAANIDMPPTAREGVIRIVREAVSNAARHGHPTTITVSTTNGDGVLVRVSDDGDGFDPSADGTGFGLISMRERAASFGGELRVRSTVGEGTEVEVRLP
jgi:signal transduction histidine kinase